VRERGRRVRRRRREESDMGGRLRGRMRVNLCAVTPPHEGAGLGRGRRGRGGHAWERFAILRAPFHVLVQNFSPLP
jgi:hypothetical protein